MAENIELTIKAMYSAVGQNWLGQAGVRTIESMELLQNKAPQEYSPKQGVTYGRDLGGRLKNLAELIKMDLGIRVATVDMGNWDTHRGQGDGGKGPFANHVQELSQGLGAFFKDLTGRKVTVISMSEFGRRLRENANRGTDHGHGGFLMALGDHVNGGRVFGRWPGFKSDELFERADLAVTTDYRTIVSEALTKRAGNSQISRVFPGFKMPQSLGIFS